MQTGQSCPAVPRPQGYGESQTILIPEGLRKSAGALEGVDIAALKQDIRDQREQNSHGRPA
jgi:hypothetical protein